MTDVAQTLCPTSLLIADVAAFWGQLQTARAAGSVAVDLAGLQRVDGAGLQLLTVLVQQGEAQGVRLKNPPAPIRETARWAGVDLVATLS